MPNVKEMSQEEKNAKRGEIKKARKCKFDLIKKIIGKMVAHCHCRID